LKFAGKISFELNFKKTTRDMHTTVNYNNPMDTKVQHEFKVMCIEV